MTERRQRMVAAARVLVALAGMALVVLVVRREGPERIADAVRRAGPVLLPAIALEVELAVTHPGALEGRQAHRQEPIRRCHRDLQHRIRDWVDVAADPAGGACASWVGERRGSPVVRALRPSNVGSIEWEYAWPVTGEVVAPRIGLDGTGAAVVSGTFRGAVSFAPGGDVTSPVEARYLARVEPDGRVSWAHALRVEPDAPHAIAVGRGGALVVNIATMFPDVNKREELVQHDAALVRAALHDLEELDRSLGGAAGTSDTGPPAPGLRSSHTG